MKPAPQDTDSTGRHSQRTERFDLNALYETSRLLSASLDLAFVLNNLLLTAMSKLLITRGAVLLYDPVEQAYRTASSKGLPSLALESLVRLPIPLPEGTLTEDAVPAELAEHRVALVLPVRFGHREIGLIALGAKATNRPFEVSELEFIQSLVNMSAAAVHNSLIVKELEQANRDLDGKIQQLDTLFEISQEFNATLNRKQLVKSLSFSLMGQMMIGRYLFLMRPGNGNRLSPGDETPFQTIASKGIRDADLDSATLSRLCVLKTAVSLADDSGEDPAWEPLKKLGIALIVPLRKNDATCALFCLGCKLTGLPFEPGEIDFLYALGNMAFVAIQNTYLIEELLEKERMEEEMRLARDIQLRLLPQEIPSFKNIDLASLAVPSRQVGGDYFDITRLADERFLVAVADVTGKGVPAALLMANLQACLHVLLPMPMSIEEATTHINRVICENTSYDKFITYFHGIYHQKTGLFDYVNAGHNPPMLLRADGSLELLETGGLLLGVMKDLAYERGTVRMAAGDLLALYTDGVTEAMSPEGEEFGEERLQHILKTHGGQTASQILNAVYNEIRRFSADPTMLSDDLTMVVLKIDGPYAP